MKNFKKLHKGMTLVEVIVAMSIFSIGAAAVTMAFSAAVKYNTHNQRRDEELSLQQAALQSGGSSAIELYGGAAQANEIVFTDTKNGNKIKFKKSNPYAYVTEYQAARSGKNDGIFDFQLKTFSTKPLGADEVVWNKSKCRYKFTVINNSIKPVDVRIVSDGGVFYTGDYDAGGYAHSSDVYWHSLAAVGSSYQVKDDPTKPDSDPTVVITDMAPEGFSVGYARDDMATLLTSPIKFLFYRDGKVFAQADLEVDKLLACDLGYVKIEVGNDDKPVLTYVDNS